MEQVIGFVIGIGLMGIILYVFRPNITCQNKKKIGVRAASVIYLDEKGTKMLIDYELGLQGKPDMIFETWILKRYIPLEIKRGLATSRRLVSVGSLFYFN